jgi:carbonic anhydrase/acetyltransferase-like protein (isoleucine patch superfamily)
MNVIGILPGAPAPNLHGARMDDSAIIGPVSAEKGSYLYRTVARGDELPPGGIIYIVNSSLNQTSVHCAPKNGKRFLIQDSVLNPGSIAHGSQSIRSTYGLFGTADLSELVHFKVGALSYVQSEKPLGPDSPANGKNGLIYFDTANFKLSSQMTPEEVAKGIEIREELSQHLTRCMNEARDYNGIPENSYVSPYAIVKDSSIGESVIAVPMCYVNESVIGDGSNVQEMVVIKNSALGRKVTNAHGAKVLNSDLGDEVFTMFNGLWNRARVGEGSILLPGLTVYPANGDVTIPSEVFVVGNIYDAKKVSDNIVDFEAFRKNHGDDALESILHRRAHIIEGNMGFPLLHSQMEYITR